MQSRSRMGRSTMGSVISRSLLAEELLNQENRKKGSVRNRFRALVFTLLVITVLIAVTLFFVWSRLRVVDLGYKTSRALKEQKELVEVNKKLRIERETLMSPKRIESYARERLGMREPQEHQIRFVP
jgi:cell division protein FtsL